MRARTRESLADALQRARDAGARGIVRSGAITRCDRELLIETGYLKDIIKGWYFSTRPIDETGQGTAWYSIFWDFLSVYLPARFHDGYCLSAMSSIEFHVGANVIRAQVTVITERGGKTVLELPHNTSLLAYEDARNLPPVVKVIDNLRVMPLVLALCRAPRVFFEQRPSDAEIALRAVKSTADLTRALLEGRYLGAAERLAGAYDFLGDKSRSEEIVSAMRSAGHTCAPENPFDKKAFVVLSGSTPVSPYAARIEALYKSMRADVLSIFGKEKRDARQDVESYLKRVDEICENDACNSLSIEGYQVTPDLIRRIREGVWNPDRNAADRREADALAARGYLESFRLVKAGIGDILRGRPAVEVLIRDYPKWYRALFSESVKAGLLEPQHLAGFRSSRVFIKGSRHVPPPQYAVPDAMESFMSLMKEEIQPAVRAVLGHFLFVFIHPYMDGNGRMARFLMNAMMASSGMPWTIIRVSRRKEYMAALEQASVERKIIPFARFVLEEMKVDWSKEMKKECRE